MFILRTKLKKYLISISLKKKLMFLFLFCVLIPLILTNSVVFYNLYKVNKIKKEQELRSDAEEVKFRFIEGLDYPSRIIQNVYKNDEIEDLLNREYYDPLDYYNAYMEFKKEFHL